MEKSTTQLERLIDLELLAQLKADLRNYKEKQEIKQEQTLQAA